MTEFEKEKYIEYVKSVFAKDKTISEAVIWALVGGATMLGTNQIDTNLLVEILGYTLGCLSTLPLTFKSIINMSYAKYLVDITPRPEEHEMYCECLDKYNSYIYNLANLLSDVPVRDDLQMAMLIDLCIQSGLFPVTGKYNYQAFSFDTDCKYLNLLGTRVILGESVCRHNAVFSSDLMNTLGYNTFYVSVDSLKRKSRKDFKTISKTSTHAVTGIVGSKGRYIYDFTWHTPAYFDKNLSMNIGVNSRTNIYLLKTLKKYYSSQGLNDKGYILSRNYFNDDISYFINAEDRIVDFLEYEEYRYLTDRLFKEYYIKIAQFGSDNNNLTNDIVHLSKTLMPYHGPKKIR